MNPLDLAASQYGGKGRLRARQIGDGSLVEIRAKALDAATALKIVETAGELALADDRALMRPLQALIESRIAELSRQRDAALVIANALSATTANSPNEARGVDHPALSLASEALAKVQLASDALWAVQSGAVGPVSQDTAVFAEAALAKPILSHWWQAVLLGAFAGAMLGFAIALSQRGKLTDSSSQWAKRTREVALQENAMLYDPERWDKDPRPDGLLAVIACAVAAISLAFAFVTLLSKDDVTVTCSGSTMSTQGLAASVQELMPARPIFNYR